MSNEINKIIETNKVTETETDPFDEALDDNIILDQKTQKPYYCPVSF